jgi:chaperonin GroES
MKVKPIGDRVLIRPGTLEQMTESGLHIPSTATSMQRERVGEVIDVGEGEMTVEGRKPFTTIKAGMKIYYWHGMGLEIKIGVETHVLLNYGEILGIVTE